MNLELSEIWDLIHYYEWESSAEVDQLVHGEGHDTGGENIVLHVGVPCGPSLLKCVEVNIVLGNLVEVVGERDRRTGRKQCRVPVSLLDIEVDKGGEGPHSHVGEQDTSAGVLGVGCFKLDKGIGRVAVI